jgi:hypothetical protein
MANVLIPKKSTVAGKVPTTSDLAHGEIAVNFADQKIFGRDPSSGTVKELGGGGGGSSAYLVQSAFAAPYNYIGRAPVGTDTTSSGWDITRIEVASDGSTTVLNATGAWSSRTSLSYT